MSPIIYALNIGTLAAWLTVSGASTVACVVHVAERLPELVSMGELDDFEVSAEVDLGSMMQGSAAPAAPDETITEEENVPEEQIAEAEIPEVPEELPEIPEIAETEPLPEIPDFPEPAPKPAAPKAESRPKPKTVARQTSGKARESTPGSRRSSSSGQSGAGRGTGSGNVTGKGSSPMGAARFAGGRFPKPRYPADARRKGIQGRVVVFFTVDERGNVINASIRSGTSDASLNEAALSAVRRAKFPPGSRATATKPIVFRLN